MDFMLDSFKRPDLDYNESPAPTYIRRTHVAEFAENIANQLAYEIGSEIESHVRRIGGNIEYLDYERWINVADDADGAIIVHAPNDFTVILPNFTILTRDRFTIAHELGHYFLHALLNDPFQPIIAARGSSDRLEWESNWFAAAFLMPEQRFRADWERYSSSIEQIANLYAVSMSAVKVRAKSLSLPVYDK